MNETRNGMEIDLQKLLLAYLQKWWLIVAATLVAAFGAWLISAHFVTPMYQSSITVYVNSVKGDQEINSISSSTLATAQKLVDTYVTMIKSDTVLEKVAEEAEETVTAAQIRQIMSAEQVDSTEIFKVIITHEDPVFAADVANAIANVAPAEIEEFVEGSSAKIIDYAKVAEKPSSPSIGRNTVLGALIGAVVAVIYLTIRFLMDVRIKDEADLNMLFDLPVLGRIPSFEEVNSKKRGYSNKYGYTTRPVTQKGGKAQ